MLFELADFEVLASGWQAYLKFDLIDTQDYN